MPVEMMRREDLPEWFDYPGEFRHIVEMPIERLTPWDMLDRALAVPLMAEMSRQYPTRSLVPFARRQDNDDFACWDRSMPGKVAIVHMWASAGWEQHEVYDDFWGWFRQAIDEMVEWTADEVAFEREQS